MDELYQQIIDTYKGTSSVKKTAEQLGTYPIKVRRVLITEGLWHSKTSDQIAELMKQGLTVSQIADKLVISEKNVQSYMPYSRGQYGGEDRSNEAIRSEEYRGRMQTAAKNQVTNTEAKSKKNQDALEEQRRLMEELKAEKERLLAEKKELWDDIEVAIKQIPLALQLHLELDMGYFDEECKEVMRKYGRMQESISRDFIVPGNMTLHGLHYAIMKAFGWQNSHLHSYVPDDEDFQKMTEGGLVKEWSRQVGMYFRFPSDDFEDIYWDDDYEEDMSFKSWLRDKYTGPYVYEGISEHYLPAQREADDFLKRFPAIRKKTTDQRNWGVIMDGQCEELLERNAIWRILLTPNQKIDWAEWKAQKEASLKAAESSKKAAIKKYVQLNNELQSIAEKAKPFFSEDGSFSNDAIPFFKEMEEKDRELGDLLIDNDPEPIPALSSLLYYYDYGDGWEVRVTCTNAWYDRSTFARNEEGDLLRDKHDFVRKISLYQDAFGREVFGEELERIQNIMRKQRPVCIAWDGMNLVDDVGGIGGFCEFLETINGSDLDKKKFYKEWAKSLGWTGRMSKPENIL